MEFGYTPAEWLRCWQDFEASIPPRPTETTRDYAEPFFHARYTNPSEALWKCNRFLMAYKYLDENLDSFERGTATIGSSKQFNIGADVIIALYRFFGHANDEQIKNPPPPSILIAAAEEQRRGKPNSRE